MTLLCCGFFGAVITLAWSAFWADAWLLLCVGAGLLLTLRARPLPASAAWRETLKIFLAPACLWLAMTATAQAASWLAVRFTAGC